MHEHGQQSHEQGLNEYDHGDHHMHDHGTGEHDHTHGQEMNEYDHGDHHMHDHGTGQHDHTHGQGTDEDNNGDHHMHDHGTGPGPHDHIHGQGTDEDNNGDHYMHDHSTMEHDHIHGQGINEDHNGDHHMHDHGTGQHDHFQGQGMNEDNLGNGHVHDHGTDEHNHFHGQGMNEDNLGNGHVHVHGTDEHNHFHGQGMNEDNQGDHRMHYQSVDEQGHILVQETNEDNNGVQHSHTQNSDQDHQHPSYSSNEQAERSNEHDSTVFEHNEHIHVPNLNEHDHKSEEQDSVESGERNENSQGVNVNENDTQSPEAGEHDHTNQLLQNSPSSSNEDQQFNGQDTTEQSGITVDQSVPGQFGEHSVGNDETDGKNEENKGSTESENESNTGTENQPTEITEQNNQSPNDGSKEHDPNSSLSNEETNKDHKDDSFSTDRTFIGLQPGVHVNNNEETPVTTDPSFISHSSPKSGEVLLGPGSTGGPEMEHTTIPFSGHSLDEIHDSTKLPETSVNDGNEKEEQPKSILNSNLGNEDSSSKDSTDPNDHEFSTEKPNFDTVDFNQPSDNQTFSGENQEAGINYNSDKNMSDQNTDGGKNLNIDNSTAQFSPSEKEFENNTPNLNSQDNTHLSEDKSPNDFSQTEQSENPMEKTNMPNEHHVPLLEDILLRESSLNDTEKPQNFTNNDGQSFLNNVERNENGEPVVEEIIVDKSSPDNDTNSSAAVDMINKNTSDDKTDSETTTKPNDREENLTIPFTDVNEEKKTISSDSLNPDNREDGLKKSESVEFESNLSEENSTSGAGTIPSDETSKTDSTNPSINKESDQLTSDVNSESGHVHDTTTEPNLANHVFHETTIHPKEEYEGYTVPVAVISDFSVDEPEPFIKNRKNVGESVNSQSSSTENSIPTSQSTLNKNPEGSEVPTTDNHNDIEIKNVHIHSPSDSTNENSTLSPSDENTEKDSKSSENESSTPIHSLEDATGNNNNSEEQKNSPNHQNTDEFSNNIKDDGTDNDNEEFNTLLDKDYKNKNEYSTDGKEVLNKYLNKQTFLKGDKKKLKDLVKGDKYDGDKKISEESTKPSVTPEDIILQKHVNENGFDLDYNNQFHTEHTTKSLGNIAKPEDGVPVLAFKPEDIENHDISVLQTVSPGVRHETHFVPGVHEDEIQKTVIPETTPETGFVNEGSAEESPKTLSNDFTVVNDHENPRVISSDNSFGDDDTDNIDIETSKTKITDNKDGDVKDKEYGKFDKDYKYEKQKGAKKKDIKKKGSSKDGKNVELDDNKKYYSDIKDQGTGRSGTLAGSTLYDDSKEMFDTTKMPDDKDINTSTESDSEEQTTEMNKNSSSEITSSSDSESNAKNNADGMNGDSAKEDKSESDDSTMTTLKTPTSGDISQSGRSFNGEAPKEPVQEGVISNVDGEKSKSTSVSSVQDGEQKDNDEGTKTSENSGETNTMKHDGEESTEQPTETSFSSSEKSKVDAENPANGSDQVLTRSHNFDANQRSPASDVNSEENERTTILPETVLSGQNPVTSEEGGSGYVSVPGTIHHSTGENENSSLNPQGVKVDQVVSPDGQIVITGSQIPGSDSHNISMVNSDSAGIAYNQPSSGSEAENSSFILNPSLTHSGFNINPVHATSNFDPNSSNGNSDSAQANGNSFNQHLATDSNSLPPNFNPSFSTSNGESVRFDVNSNPPFSSEVSNFTTGFDPSNSKIANSGFAYSTGGSGPIISFSNSSSETPDVILQGGPHPNVYRVGSVNSTNGLPQAFNFNVSSHPNGFLYKVFNSSFSNGNASGHSNFPSIVKIDQNGFHQNGSAFNASDFSTFISSFPQNGNSTTTVYRLENGSLPGTVFDGHFNPQEGHYHMLTNASGTFVYSSNEPAFVIKGDSGDFGRSTVYILGNNSTANGSHGNFTVSPHSVLFRNSSVFTVRNLTENGVPSLVHLQGNAFQTNGQKSNQSFQFTPSNFAAGTTYKVGDYFGYISKCVAGW